MTKQEIKELLNIKNFSNEYYDLLKQSDMMTRQEFNNRGYIFAQIGINGCKCQGNCKFCSMAEKYYTLEKSFEKTDDEIIRQVKDLVNENIDDIFLMTTANYSMDKFLNLGSKIRKIIPDDIRLVANIGDFSYDTALDLKSAGYTGVYHIRRLREGIDTDIKPQQREKSIENALSSGLELYYCIEPIGPEHTYDEIADEILYASELNVGAMAVMRRIAVKGTIMYSKGQITNDEFLKICAVTRIATKPTRSMNAHETVESSLLCGVNQLYAEYGSNPRDTVLDTNLNRGLSVQNVKRLFDEYKINYKK